VTLAIGWFSVIVGGIITGSNLIFVYPKVREIKDIDQHCQKLEAEAAQVEMRIKRLEHEAEELSDDIRTSVRKFVEKDKLI
jgi:cell division protein FtsB